MPLLPLETFRALMRLHPWHFWQTADSDLLRVNSQCNTILYQYGWQTAQFIGRDEILEAIERAEATIKRYLGYAPAPAFAEQTLAYPRYDNVAYDYTAPIDASGRWQSVALRNEQHIQALGVETLTTIAAASALVYSDADGDGLQETWTLGPVATTVTDVSEIAVYFNAADRWDGSGVSERWRITPVNVRIAGGFVTVTGKRWQVVKPVLYEGAALQTIDPAVAGNFAASLDLMQRWCNPDGTTATTSQGVLIWETEPEDCACCGCSAATTSSSHDPAAWAEAVARVGERDFRLGLVIPGQAVYNATTGVWSAVDWSQCTQPDRVLIRSYAGYPLQSSGQMDAEWARTVARLAAAELAAPICGCDIANKELYRWQFDLARTAGNNDEAYGAISAEVLNNPLGTRRGQVEAWKRICAEHQPRGVSF